MDKYCQNCNQANPADAAFCRNCSAPLTPNQFGSQQGSQQQFDQSSGGASSEGASQRAIISLVLAIAGLICCGPFTGIPAAILGWMEVGAIKRGESSQSGMTLAQIGLWGGIAVTILHSLIGIGYFILMLGAAATSDPYGY